MGAGRRRLPRLGGVRPGLAGVGLQEAVEEVTALGAVEVDGFAQQAFAAEAEVFGEAAGGVVVAVDEGGEAVHGQRAEAAFDQGGDGLVDDALAVVGRMDQVADIGAAELGGGVEVVDHAEAAVGGGVGDRPDAGFCGVGGEVAADGAFGLAPSLSGRAVPEAHYFGVGVAW